MAVLYHIAPVLDVDGTPSSGARVEFYESGTSTGLDVYDDDDRTLSRGVILTADSVGRFDPVYLASADYRVVIKTASGVTLQEIDPVHGRPIESMESPGGIGLSMTDDGGPNGEPSLVPGDVSTTSSFKNACRAYAFVNGNGTFDQNKDIYNVYEIDYKSPGRYTLKYGGESASKAHVYNKGVPLACAYGATNTQDDDELPMARHAKIISMNFNQATVEITNEVGARIDSAFTFVLFGQLPAPSS